MTTVDIAPAIADHPTAGEIESESSGGIKQHSRRRFAPRAGRRTVTGVVADLNVINTRYELSQMCMHSLDHGLRLGATPTSGWLVATISTKPAALRRAQLFATPSSNVNSSTVAGGYGLPLCMIGQFNVPSRSRKTAGLSEGWGMMCGDATTCAGRSERGRHGLPIGLVYFQVGVRDKEMPDYSLKRLGVGCDIIRVHSGYDYACVGNYGGVAAVLSQCELKPASVGVDICGWIGEYALTTKLSLFCQPTPHFGDTFVRGD